MDNFIFIAVGFALAAILGKLIIPGVLLVAFDKKLFDLPDERKVHDRPIPRLGGVTFFPVIVFVISAMSLYQVHYCDGYMNFFKANVISELLALLAALILLYFIGVGDDLVGVRYSRKFFVQIVAAMLIPTAGLYINNFYGLFGVGEIPAYVGIPFTLLLVVFVTNAINLIDGIDGLASGLSMVALVVFGITFAIGGMWMYGLLAFVCVGVIIPFFCYNVFGNADKGHKIFMGDAGSLTLGFILSLMAIKYSMYRGDMSDAVDGAPLITAFSILLVPCLDVCRVVIRRLKRKQNPFKPDRTHLHHKFLLMGFKPRTSMMLILLMAVCFIVLTHTLINVGVSADIVFVCDLLIWIIINIWFSFVIKRKELIINK